MGAAASIDEMLMSGCDILDHPGYSDDERAAKLAGMFIRAASNGDIGRVTECLTSEIADWIDLEAADEYGTTALISAACFGHVDLLRILLDAGACVDTKDKNGWTALMWACANGYQDAATVLIEYGADKHAKSNRGRSVVDLSTKNGNNDIVRMLDPVLAEKRERKAAKAARLAQAKLAAASGTPVPHDPDADPLSPTTGTDLGSELTEDADDQAADDSDEDLLVAETAFEWDKCRPDQMFVFEERIVDHILDIAVRRIRPTRGPDYVPVGANIIFLCARYAHYWNSSDMLRDFLNRAIEKIVSVLRASPDDVHFYAYWLSNTMQLLVYMKRDTGLLISTFDAQCLLSELIQEIYQQLVSSIERSILSIIDLAIIDYKKLDATSRVRYEPVFFGIGKRKSLLKLNQQYSPPRSPRSARSVRSAQLPMYELSPMSVNSILSSTLNVLKSCKVHQQVVHQLFHQLVYFINAELFNRIISTKELCCRARAQQIQLNLSPIQDWIRENTANLPQITGPAASYGRRGPLVQHLRPTMQLTQFLQVISATQDLGSFLELTRSMDALNTAHYHKSMENYRYEIGETSFSPEIEAYVQKLIDEFTVDKRTNGQLRHVQPRRLRHDADSEVPNGDVDSSGSSLAVSGAAGGSTSSSASDGSEDTTYRSSEDDMADDQLQDALNPLLDARAVLPFSVPNFGRNDTLWDYVPSIPAQVMEMMDDRSTVGAELTVSRAGVPSGRLTPLAAAATGFLAPILNTVGLAPTAAAPAASS